MRSRRTMNRCCWHVAFLIPWLGAGCDGGLGHRPSTAEAVVLPAPCLPAATTDEAPSIAVAVAEPQVDDGVEAPPPPPEPAATSAPASVPTAAGASSATAGPHADRPRWLVASTGPARGDFVLRCEGTRDHPTEAAGGCACGATVLNPCTDEAGKRIVDRRQCGFTCAPSHGSTFVLRCPDGTPPSASARGCQCGAQLLDPCAGSTSRAVSARGNVCTVTCG